MAIKNSSGVTIMHITQDRRVGIGTESPDASSRLDISGLTRTTTLQVTTSPTTGFALTSNASGLANWGQIGTAGLANNAVTSTKIVDGAIGTADIANAAVTGAKLDNTGVIAGRYCNATITVDAQGRITTANNGLGNTAENVFISRDLDAADFSLTSSYQQVLTLNYGPGVWVLTAMVFGAISKTATTGAAGIDIAIEGLVYGTWSTGSAGRVVTVADQMTSNAGTAMIQYTVWDTFGTSLRLMARYSTYGTVGTVTATLHGRQWTGIPGPKVTLVAVKIRDI